MALAGPPRTAVIAGSAVRVGRHDMIAYLTMLNLLAYLYNNAAGLMPGNHGIAAYILLP